MFVFLFDSCVWSLRVDLSCFQLDLIGKSLKKAALVIPRLIVWLQELIIPCLRRYMWRCESGMDPTVDGAIGVSVWRTSIDGARRQSDVVCGSTVAEADAA